MAIGQLRHRVELQSLSQAPDPSSGGLTDTYTTFATVWAEVEAAAPTRFDGDMQIDERVTHRVTARWRDDYRNARFLRFDARRFVVRGVRHLDGAKRHLQFLVEEMKVNA